MRDSNEIMAEADAYVEAHLLALYRELKYLWDNGFLPSLDCHILELRAILESLTHSYCALAETMITKAAVHAYVRASEAR